MGKTATSDEIERLKEDAKIVPTNADNFESRLTTIDGWIRLLVMGRVNRDEMIRIAPPGVTNQIGELRNSGSEGEAYSKVDSLIAGLGRMPLNSQGGGRGGMRPPEQGSFQPGPTAGTGKALQGKFVEVNFPPREVSVAKVNIDYLKESELSKYIFGVIGGGDNEKGFAFLRESGFRMVKVIVSRSSEKIPGNLDNPAEYDFSRLDKEMQRIFDAGAEPMVYFLADRKPHDMQKFSIYIKNMARHFSEGWGGGLRLPIKVFRFGNEPDSPVFWKDSKEAFYETYAAWARAVKEVNKAFIVGGPGVAMATGNTPLETDYTALNSFTKNFLEYCNREKAPLDYFSFHAYGPVAYFAFYKQASLLMTELRKYPKLSPVFGMPRLANDEWDFLMGSPWSGTYHKEFNDAFGAAGGTLLLTNMVREGLWLSIKQGGVFVPSKKPSGAGSERLREPPQGIDLTLVTPDNERKLSYYAFMGFNMLGNSNSLLLSTGTDDHINFASVAGKDKGGGITVVMSNFDMERYLRDYTSGNAGDLSYTIARQDFNNFVKERNRASLAVYDRFQLTLNNLPWKEKDNIIYERYVVDGGKRLEKVESRQLTGAPVLAFTVAITMPSVQVIKIFPK